MGKRKRKVVERKAEKDVGDKRADEKETGSKINCSRHLVITGKVITCAAFSSTATYPCRISPNFSPFFLYFRLTPVIEKGWASRVPDKSSSKTGENRSMQGEEKP